MPTFVGIDIVRRYTASIRLGTRFTTVGTMAKETDKLTALGVKHLAREGAPSKKHFDGCGLYLDVRDNGSRYWRMAYRFARRENSLP